MSRELTLSQLTTELTDFLGLPQDLDLPPIRSVECRRTADGDWSVRAVLAAHGQDAHEAIGAWAAYTGGTVQESSPYATTAYGSGLQRTLSLRVVVAEVPIELCTFVDGLYVLVVPPAEGVAV